MSASMVMEQLNSSRPFRSFGNSLDREATVNIVPSVVVALDPVGKIVAESLAKELNASQQRIAPRVAFLVPGEAQPETFQLLSTSRSGSFIDMAWQALNLVGDYANELPRLEASGLTIAHRSRAIYFVGSIDNPVLGRVEDGELVGIAIEALRLLKERGIDLGVRAAMLTCSVPSTEEVRRAYYQRLREFPWRELLTCDDLSLEEEEEETNGDATPESADALAGDASAEPVPGDPAQLREADAEPWEEESLTTSSDPPLTFCYLFTYQDNRDGYHAPEDIQACLQQTLLALLTSGLYADQGGDLLLDMHAIGNVDRDSWNTYRRIGTIGTAQFVYPRPLILTYCADRLAGEIIICRGLLPPADVRPERMGPDWQERLPSENRRFEDSVRPAVEEANKSAFVLMEELTHKTSVPVSSPRDVGTRRRLGRHVRRDYGRPIGTSELCADYAELYKPYTLEGVNVESPPDTWLTAKELHRPDAAGEEIGRWEALDSHSWNEFEAQVRSRISKEVDQSVQEGMKGIAAARSYLNTMAGELDALLARADQEAKYERAQWDAYIARRWNGVPRVWRGDERSQSQEPDDVSHEAAAIMNWLARRIEDAYRNVPRRDQMFPSLSLAIPLGFYILRGFFPVDQLPLPAQVLVYLLPFIFLATAWILIYNMAWRHVQNCAVALMTFYQALITRRIEAHEHRLRNTLLQGVREEVNLNTRCIDRLISLLQNLADRFDRERRERESDHSPQREISGVRPEEYAEYYAQVDRARRATDDDDRVTAWFLDTLWTSRKPKEPVYLLPRSDERAAENPAASQDAHPDESDRPSAQDEHQTSTPGEGVITEEAEPTRLDETCLRARLFEFSRNYADRYLKGGVESVRISDPDAILRQMQSLAVPLAQATPVAGLALPRSGSMIFAESETNVFVRRIVHANVRHVKTHDRDRVTLANFLVGFWPRFLSEASVTGEPELDVPSLDAAGESAESPTAAH